MLDVWKRPTVADIKAVISFATTSLTIKVKSCMNLVRALLIKKNHRLKFMHLVLHHNLNHL